MIRLFPSQSPLLKLFLVSVSLSGAFALTGCGASGLFPESTAVSPAATEVPVGSIKGSNYGGHAPLVGAHIYLLQTGNSGYGSVTKGLLNASYSGSYSTTKNPATGGDQFVPAADSAGNPYYYETADAYGQFNLTGDYTCTVGQPVYIVGYGGSPSFVGTGPNVFTLSGADTAYSNGTHAIFTYTVTSPLPELFYVGEPVAVTSFTGGSTGFNISGTIADPGDSTKTVTVSGTMYTPTLTTTQFSIYVSTTLPAGTYTPLGGTYTNAVATGSPAFNPAAVNMAMLGVCPSSGNFSTGATALQYVYMNEISTTAMAYAMNAYVPWGTTDQSGNDEFHIGAPSTTQAQQGIQNAAINAGNLYDIQHAAVSSTGDGEGHLARSVTASGAGIVPQTLIDTIGNTLAACVDSNNTYRNGSGTQSPQCLTLDQYAQDNGYYDTTASTHYAFNIAQAAFNIARYPQGLGTATTSSGVQTVTAGTAITAANFTKALTNLPSGDVPFAPNLASPPNDFAVAINWQTSPYALSGTQTGSTTNLATVGELAIDSLGNAWIVNNVYNGGDDVLELSPSGYYNTFASRPLTAVGTTSIAGIAIDTSNNLFISSTAGVQELTAASSYTNGGLIGYIDGNNYARNITANAAQLAVDNSGFLYIANLDQPNPPASSSGSLASSLVKEPTTIGGTTATFTVTGGNPTANSASSCASYLGDLTLDASGNIWTSNQNNVLTPDATVCRFDTNGNLQYSYVLTPNSTSGLPHQIAIDASGNAWVTDKDNNDLIKIAAGATNTAPTNGAATLYTPGVLSLPKGVAVDGNNTIWVTNTGNASITQFNTAGALVSPTFYESTTNTVPGGGTPSETYAVVDQSGNLWSADIGHGQILEYIGVAGPTVQPLAQQRAGTAGATGHGIGQKP